MAAIRRGELTFSIMKEFIIGEEAILTCSEDFVEFNKKMLGDIRLNFECLF